MDINKSLLDTSKVICKNISMCDDSQRGLLSQNILSQLRNFVEYVALKIMVAENNIDSNPFKYKDHTKALKYIRSKGNFKFLADFHSLLQKVASHYTLDENGSERLMLKYYEYLLKIKVLLKGRYDLEVLENINEFPLYVDNEMTEYYNKISEKIVNPTNGCTQSNYQEKYYIYKIKPFFVKEKIFYEVTFSAATDSQSKFDRIIAYTECEILSNYAVKLSIHYDSICVLGKNVRIQVIDDWEVAIRACELKNFGRILGLSKKISAVGRDYQAVMNYIKDAMMPLSELVTSPDELYNSVKESIQKQIVTSYIFEILDECRNIIFMKEAKKENNPGSNVLIYLLYHLNNKIIKYQISEQRCSKLNNLYLKSACIPFDEMPFCTSLPNHNPQVYDLLQCLPLEGREDELFARRIKNNVEIERKLFTPVKELVKFENYPSLIDTHNKKLYLHRHYGRRLLDYKNNIYICEYVQDIKFIIKKLQMLASKGLESYSESINFWLTQSSCCIDSPEKEDVLKDLFSESKVAIVYGSAGTGKSTLINYISNVFKDKNKLFLAHTHSAINNLRRKIGDDSGEFKTITKFLEENAKGNTHEKVDILIIDECSIISNRDMKRLLERCEFDCVVLVGDVFQIQSICFGNWFDIASKFIDQKAIFELESVYRTKDENLLTLWNKVRKVDYDILENLLPVGYSSRLDESIFSLAEKDEIILCLNYGGLYGVNNINRLLQMNNPNKEIGWGTGIYKIGDPVLFNEKSPFSPVIYNNAKGYIVNIEVEERKIWFEVELDYKIETVNEAYSDLKLMGVSERGNSIVGFYVEKYKSADEEYDDSRTVVPFQIAYAVSIHKAQGLEYKSVKIVITNEVEERITHNIFYTAITRAKEKLKIYWSPETEQHILKKLTIRDDGRDVNLLKSLCNL